MKEHPNFVVKHNHAIDYMTVKVIAVESCTIAVALAV